MISKSMRIGKTVLCFIGIIMIGIVLTITTDSIASTDSDDIVELLAHELKLHDQQKQNLNTEMERYANQLNK